MRKSLQGTERGITFAPATRKNGDAKTPRGVAERSLKAWWKPVKISSKDEVSTGADMETYQERSYGVHVINKSIGTGDIWNKKKNKKRYTTKSLILAQDER